MTAEIPRLLAITPPGFSSDVSIGRAWGAVLGAALAESPLPARCVRLQARDPGATADRLRDAVERLLELPGLETVAWSLNGRPEDALRLGASGVHLRASAPDVGTVSADLLVGRSTHSVDEVRCARSRREDYVVFGPVHDTPSKRRFGDPVGLGGLARACQVGLPVLAIGGIDASRVDAVLRAGARGVAAIRACGDEGVALALCTRLAAGIQPR